MTDEQITALMARLRTFVQRNGHNDMAVTTIDTDHARAILALVDAQAAEIARLRAGIAEVKARGVAMQNDAYTEGEKDIGWGWEWAGEWLEAFAQETQP